MVQELWADLKREPAARGLMSQPVRIVGDADINNVADLPSYEQYQADS